ncbi:MAG: 30S ribosomal protein S13 [Candidatus Kerfeldbacteria bacterium RIFOXYA2_FULL_38_24]|uniref:Small ribosomal subunit protein uS13 n=1 Tax=Candidatus Kerfeldbacteria bacterium RIFOXYB2_FULL_38_14 TaxID=1798547 RepID=A0A1G2BA48_9BACT|nr:MAG: 30S ribosomal protein S13 [Candidatus Kerfeldbacteria bacterium RIFOXYA2_FULL_38_24]OGY86054.1 MAG: 30S ribosomal protein S13 [Candidatus Kerfeldbacteria bacterium RIFOXYB2_FULL_38_14]OGY88887.1 MAG: 30S ribosomal protein S13 [Candidatus Kerfeldbacteria bacterium RIFOXYC2_FULL_38_9]
MARIAGITLPKDKRVEIALTYIFGIGLKTSQNILKTTKVSPDTRVKDLTEEEVQKLREQIERGGIKIEGDLKREIFSSIKRLKEIGSYRGSRHIKHLPARGQKTKTNNRTVRGNVRKTAGSGRKSAAEKT